MNAIYVHIVFLLASALAVTASPPLEVHAAGVDASGHVSSLARQRALGSEAAPQGSGLMRRVVAPAVQTGGAAQDVMADVTPSDKNDSLEQTDESTWVPWQWLAEQEHSDAGPIDCLWSDWGPFSACSVTCGQGRMTRDREVGAPPENGGAPCSGSLLQEAPCSKDPCPLPRGAALLEADEDSEAQEDGEREPEPSSEPEPDANGNGPIEKDTEEPLDGRRFVLQRAAGAKCLPGTHHVMSRIDCQNSAKAIGATWGGGVNWKDHVSGCFALEQRGRGAKVDVYFNAGGQDLGLAGNGMAVCNKGKKADALSEALLTMWYQVQPKSGPCSTGTLMLQSKRQCEAAATALGKKWYSAASVGTWKGHLPGCFEGVSSDGKGTGVLHWNMLAASKENKKLGKGLAVCARGEPRFMVMKVSAAACSEGFEPITSANQCKRAAKSLQKDWSPASIDRWSDHVSGCFEGDLSGTHNGRFHFNEGGQQAGPHGFLVCKEKRQPNLKLKKDDPEVQKELKKEAKLIEQDADEDEPEGQESASLLEGNEEVVAGVPEAAFIDASAGDGPDFEQGALEHPEFVGTANLLQACPGGSVYNPSEEHRNYSSSWGFGACKNSQLDTIKHCGAWVAGKNKTGQWMQIDLQEVKKIRGTVVQGQRFKEQWVTKYSVAYSEDGENWKLIPGDADGSKDMHHKVTSDFSEPVHARYVRFFPREWNGWPAMRAGVLGCEAELPGQTTNETTSAEGTGHMDEPKECPGALLNPPEWWRKYSSVQAHDKDDKHYFKYSMLDSTKGAGAWEPAENRGGEWMQIYLHQAQWIKGTVTQGRKGSPDWVTHYKVAYSVDGKKWDVIANDLTGNNDDHTQVTHNFEKPVLARFVRFYPKEWHDKIAMRAGVLGCEHYDFNQTIGSWKKWSVKIRHWANKHGRHNRTGFPGSDQGEEEGHGTVSAGEDPGPPGDMGTPGPPGPPGVPVVPPPIDCEFNEWEQWSDCTKSCGEYGTRGRQRDIKIYPQNSGKNCDGEHHQEEACNRVECPATPAPMPVEPPAERPHEKEHNTVVVVPVAPPQTAPAPVVVKEHERPPPPVAAAPVVVNAPQPPPPPVAAAPVVVSPGQPPQPPVMAAPAPAPVPQAIIVPIPAPGPKEERYEEEHREEHHEEVPVPDVDGALGSGEAPMPR